MYLTLKVLIDQNSIDENVLKAYTKIFTDEVKRAAEILKISGTPLNKTNISKSIPYTSGVNVLKEAFRVSKLKKISSNYIVSPIWNPTSYCLRENELTLYFGETFTVMKTSVKLLFNEYHYQRMKQCQLRSVKVRKIDSYYYAFFIMSISEKKHRNQGNKMGIDLGVRVPAVCVTSNKKIKFVGNGRYLRFLERSLRSKYNRLQKNQKLNEIRKMNHKLSRRKYHLDHEYSRAIINFAIAENVFLIKMEKLTGLQARVAKTATIEVYDWSYHRLQRCVAQKAKEEGIQVLYVNPQYTSRKCPLCNAINSPQSRKYICHCGYTNHRDIVGAINILNST